MTLVTKFVGLRNSLVRDHAYTRNFLVAFCGISIIVRSTETVPFTKFSKYFVGGYRIYISSADMDTIH